MVKIMLKLRFVVVPSLLAVALVWTASAAWASGEHDKMHGMDMQHEGNMKHGQNMPHDKGMIMVGEQTEAGVTAMAHLRNAREVMAKMGMKTTHHLMVQFTKASSGTAIESGTAIVTVKAPSGKEVSGLKMMGMGGHFGKDVALTERGMYEFTVDTVLADGKTRRFHFSYKLE